jgi:hypothetical protein
VEIVGGLRTSFISYPPPQSLYGNFLKNYDKEWAHLTAQNFAMKKETFETLSFSEKNVDEMTAISQEFYLEMKRRRSVRDFSSRSIPVQVIENAIRAAGTAPAALTCSPGILW